MSIKGVKSVILIVIAFWIFIIGWHTTVYGDYAACFNLERDYKQFLTSGNSGYIASIPCPANGTLLKQTLPIDESGK